MTITFVSNFINHHQVHLADEFSSSPGIEYHFVETEPMPEAFAKAGYPDYSSRPYLIKAYNSDGEMKEARNLIDTSDVVIIGSAPEKWVWKREKENRITFHYSERWFRKGTWRLLDPRLIRFYFLNHTRFRNKRSYMLCASAFTASDVRKVFAYPNKCFKWGYFTKVNSAEGAKINLEAPLGVSRLRILFVARFLILKHPELPVLLAQRLKQKGYDFEINMYGNGPEYGRIEKLIRDLGVEDVVNLCGNKPNDEILQEMSKHDIFLFTSDRHEGWGAVVNEAMSQGCAVVASNKIGSVPYLIEDGINGFQFEDGSLKDLTEKVEKLFNDSKLLNKARHNAKLTMQKLWSPANAAASFISLVNSIIINPEAVVPAQKGPCSKA